MAGGHVYAAATVLPAGALGDTARPGAHHHLRRPAATRRWLRWLSPAPGAGGHVYAVATVLPAGTLGDPAAAGVYTNAVPRPTPPGRPAPTAPRAVPRPGAA